MVDVRLDLNSRVFYKKIYIIYLGAMFLRYQFFYFAYNNYVVLSVYVCITRFGHILIKAYKINVIIVIIFFTKFYVFACFNIFPKVFFNSFMCYIL